MIRVAAVQNLLFISVIIQVHFHWSATWFVASLDELYGLEWYSW
jgi:hypothetical protein